MNAQLELIQKSIVVKQAKTDNSPSVIPDWLYDEIMQTAQDIDAWLVDTVSWDEYYSNFKQKSLRWVTA